MLQRDHDIMIHIIRYCERVKSYLDKLDENKDKFMDDLMCQDACCMCIAQIGELSGHLSSEFKEAHKDLPWREIKDTRNYYVHNYGGVDLNYVWNTMIVDLPLLQQCCQAYLDEE